MKEVLVSIAQLAGLGLVAAIGLVGIVVLISGGLPHPDDRDSHFGFFRLMVGVLLVIGILALAGVGLLYLMGGKA